LSDEPEKGGDGKFRAHGRPLSFLTRGLLAALTLLGCVWSAQLHDAFSLVVFLPQYLALMLGVGLSACFIGIKTRPGEQTRGVPWYDWIAVLASLVVCGYVVVRYPELVTNLGGVETERWVLGTITTVLVIEATRRLIGWALIVLAVLGIFYALFSDLMPGVLYGPSTEWTRLAVFLYLDGGGIIGLPLTVFATIIIPFILFGQVLYAVGGDKVLTEVAMSLMGRYRGGPAKVAVGASSLFGTISGSVISNVMTDGPVTIPMMTRSGYPKHLAAAIEAVASNGGQIMPPVMGLTAFLIADMLNIAYANVVIAAAVPALLYYFALFIQVDLEAAKNGLVGLPRESLPRPGDVWKRAWVFAAPFILLMYTLVELDWQPGKSALAAIGATIVVGALRRDTRPTITGLWHAVVETGRVLLDLVAVVAVAGIIIGTLNFSGLAFGLSLVVVTLAGGVLLVLLFVTALLSIVLGMGLPTSIVYLLLASLIAPALVDFGVAPLAAHMFLFYFGTMSSITPPLCFATFAAATIAGCNFWQAGWAGMRLAFVAYIVPFIFVLHPELLMIGTPLRIAVAVITAVVGVSFVSAAFVGHFFASLGKFERALLGFAGLCLIPSPANAALAAVNAAGLLAGAGVLGFQYLRTRNAGRAASRDNPARTQD